MGATHPNYGYDENRGKLGYNSATKKHGGQKRKVACFLKDRGYTDIATQLSIIQRFGFSCKVIADERWTEFKSFVDNLNTQSNGK